MHRGPKYLTWLSEELPAFVRTVFPSSKKRENTFTAGLSMGGYGALYTAFHRPETYAACASLSGALDIAQDLARTAEIGKGAPPGPFQWDAIYEHPEKIAENDLFALIRAKKAAGAALPKVFQSCGTEDFTWPLNTAARKKMEDLGIDLTWEQHPGSHTWTYWDTHIQRAPAAPPKEGRRGRPGPQ